MEFSGRKYIVQSGIPDYNIPLGRYRIPILSGAVERGAPYMNIFVCSDGGVLTEVVELANSPAITRLPLTSLTVRDLTSSQHCSHLWLYAAFTDDLLTARSWNMSESTTTKLNAESHLLLVRVTRLPCTPSSLLSTDRPYKRRTSLYFGFHRSSSARTSRLRSDMSSEKERLYLPPSAQLPTLLSQMKRPRRKPSPQSTL
jgi:hypothetical protein